MERVVVEEEEDSGLIELLDSGSLFYCADPSPSPSPFSTLTCSKSFSAPKEESKERRNKKQRKLGASASFGTIKVRKDKLGDKISALQQLVSPFGKSDTASVLHEALGYIHFLHKQVQVLSSPYLQRMPTLQVQANGRELQGDLRSRGLCLAPILCTEEVANDNGADLWSPAMGSTNLDTKH